MASIYMYHAVGEEAAIADADPHYAVSCDQFRSHIKLIENSEPVATQLLKYGQVTKHSITFDDGHLSNYSNALPILIDADIRAEFYVNSSVVGQKNLATWPQLAEMAQAGMTIQSHGHRHVYMSDLSNKEIENELATSKSMIEDHIGQEVTVFAPPGGRFDDRVVDIAKALGYQCLAVSRPGTCANSKQFIVPRFAVFSSTSAATIFAWQSPFSRATASQVIKYKTTGALKRMMGNDRYDLFRKNVLRLQPQVVK